MTQLHRCVPICAISNGIITIPICVNSIGTIAFLLTRQLYHKSQTCHHEGWPLSSLASCWVLHLHFQLHSQLHSSSHYSFGMSILIFSNFYFFIKSRKSNNNYRFCSIKNNCERNEFTIYRLPILRLGKDCMFYVEVNKAIIVMFKRSPKTQKKCDYLHRPSCWYF